MKKIIPRLIGWYFNLLVFIAPRYTGRQGFYLFCTPRSAPLKDHQRKFLDTAEKTVFENEGIRIQAYRWGHGPRRILFLHGWQSHSFRWKNYIEALPKDEFTLFAFDAPGHGQSEGTYLNLPIYSKVIETFVKTVPQLHAVVGHSLGSFAILYTLFRLRNNLSLEQLIITAPPGEVSEFVEFYQNVLGLSSRTVNAIRQSFAREIDYLPEYFSAKRFVERLDLPGLIIHDEQDVETPYAHALTIHKLWKTSKLVSTSGLGHNLRSASVVSHVVDFVSQYKNEFVTS